MFSVVLFFLFINPIVYSQTLDEFSKQVDEEFADFNKETDEEFEAFKKEIDQKFNDFVTQIDQEFSDYLGESFEAYDIGHEKYDASKPKPNEIPVVEETVAKGDFIDFKLNEPGIVYQGPVYPGIKKTEAKDFQTQKINVEFLGWPLYFLVDKSFSQIEIYKPSGQSIASIWDEFAGLNYNHFLYQLSEVANTLNLNQWGYFQLLKECSKQIYNDKNTQVLFQWTMLSRSRYKVKIGFTNDDLFLLVPSVYKMYDIDFVKVKGINYYVMDGNGEQLQTYEKDFPETDILMDVTISKPFYTYPIKKSKEFKFSYNKKDYAVTLKFDEQMIKFYNTIPLSDVLIYFNSVISERTRESVEEAFFPIIEGKSDYEAASILLSFVQQAFDYKTDQQTFGKERYFFADELLHYPYADCEDRSVLYAYLIKTLLKKEVVALGFPGHMATAINLGEIDEGLSVSYNNKKYLVADPTLLGAPPGVLIPSVFGETADLIVLDNGSYKFDLATKAWELTGKSGGFKAGRQNDLIFDEEGNIYVCGYFMQAANFGGIELMAEDEGRDVFVAKYDNDLNVIWAKSALGNGSDLAFSLCQASDGGIYVYGSFETDLNFDGTEIIAVDASDVFVAKYSSGGELEWAKKAGIDKLDHNLDFMFAAKFNPEGEKIMAKLYSQTENFYHYGIEIDNDGNALIKGSFFATSGMSSNDYVNYNTVTDSKDVPVILHEIDKQLKKMEFEETIAGLFAALNFLDTKTGAIEGKQIEKAFSDYNVKDIQNSEVYKKLLEMDFVRNDKGIVTIATSEGNPIEIEMIRIYDEAQIRIVDYDSKNILVEVLSGINIFKGSKSWEMNSINLYRTTGDMVLSFGENDIKKKLSLKSEILKR